MRSHLRIALACLLAGCGRTDIAAYFDATKGEGSVENVPDTSPSLSQSWLAFQVANWDSSMEIRAVDISGREPDRVLSTEPFFLTRAYFETDAQASEGAFRWSPDGSMLIYFGVAESQGKSHWWSPQFLVDFVNFTSPPAVEVAIEDNDKSGGFWDSHWTADSRYLWFNLGWVDERPDIYLADVTDRVARPGKLILDRSANYDRIKWSPDGYRFVYEHGKAWGTAPDDELMFVSAIGGQGTAPRRLYPPFPEYGHVYCWEWSPDGNWMTYVRPSDEDLCGLYAVEVKGDLLGEPLQLSPDPRAECTCGYWSPDSRRIVFSARTPPSKQRSFFQADFVDAAAPVVSQISSTLPSGHALRFDPDWLDTSRVIMPTENSDETETRFYVIDFREQSPVARALNVPPACGGFFLDNGPDSISYIHWSCTSRCGVDDTTTVLGLQWAEVTGSDSPVSLGLHSSCGDGGALSADRSLFAVVARPTVKEQGLRDLYYLRFEPGTVPEPVKINGASRDLDVSPRIETLKWSPNGEAIAFLDEHSVLYWAEAMPSASVHRLTAPDVGAVGFAWRNDGSSGSRGQGL